jgi:hypothetical protein
MITPVCDWRFGLLDEHRDLFGSTRIVPVLAPGYPRCGPGWRPLLDSACTRIQAALVAGDSVEILQIREKNGALRLYWRGKLSRRSQLEVEEAVALAEARSACTCDQCGKEGRLLSRGRDLMTRCSIDSPEEAVPLRQKSENIYLVRVGKARGSRAFACCRYDRASDTFIELDVASLAAAA